MHAILKHHLYTQAIYDLQDGIQTIRKPPKYIATYKIYSVRGIRRVCFRPRLS